MTYDSDITSDEIYEEERKRRENLEKRARGGDEDARYQLNKEDGFDPISEQEEEDRSY